MTAATTTTPDDDDVDVSLAAVRVARQTTADEVVRAARWQPAASAELLDAVERLNARERAT